MTTEDTLRVGSYAGNKITAAQLRTELAQYYGTEHYYKHQLSKSMVYTDGARAFAQLAEAYWLLDIIATEIAPLLKTEDFLSIEVMVAKDKARIHVDDGNQAMLYKKSISYTDCPAGEWMFFLTNNVLMLPSEY